MRRIATLFWLALAAASIVGIVSLGEYGATANGQTTAPSTQPSPAAHPIDAWLGTLPHDANGLIDVSKIIATRGYRLVYIGTQQGDFADYKSAENGVVNPSHAAGVPIAVVFRPGSNPTAAILSDSFQTNGLSADLPTIFVGSNNAFPHGIGIGSARQATKWIIVSGFDIYDPNHVPSSPTFAPTAQSFVGININSIVPGGCDVLVQDCHVHDCSTGLNVTNQGGPLIGFKALGCSFANCWQYKPGQASYGVYMTGIRDFDVDTCVIYQCGWAPATATWGGYPKNDMSHGLYLQKQEPGDYSDLQTRVRNCIIADNASFGLEQRPGGDNDNNLFLGNPMAMYEGAPSSGCRWSITNDVVDGGGGEFDLSVAGSPRGWGPYLNCVPSGLISHVICINKPDKVNGGFAISVKCDSTPPVPTIATLDHCIVHGWTGSAFDVGGTPGSVTFLGDDFGIPMIAPTPVKGYINPLACTASYANTLGIAGVINARTFVVAALMNRQTAWDARLTASSVNNFIRAALQVKQ